MDAMPGRATPQATQDYAARHGMPDGLYRSVGGLSLSSLGLGSYLGTTDEAARVAYEESALAALRGGVNVLDTAANYRDQRSERDLGHALQRYVQGGGSRDEVLVSTKAGFLHGDADSDLGKDWFQSEYVLDGTVRGPDIVGHVHCMTPAYIGRELERSLANLGVQTIDVFHLHNPETQLAAGVGPDRFYAAVRRAFEVLERACDDGRIKAYGVATWDGLRTLPDQPGHLSLIKLVHEAGQARMALGGEAREHHFRAVQLPVNMALPEAATLPTQPVRNGVVPALELAKELGVYVQASASLMQARLDGHVPKDVREGLGASSDLEAAWRWTSGQDGVHTALVGMGRPAHVEENLSWARRLTPAA